jgi:hypothetical protein
MWNISNPIERRAGNTSPYPFGGIAPLRQELSLHSYMEKKLMYAEMERLQPIRALQTAIVHAIQTAVRASGAAAPAILTFRRSTDCQSAQHLSRDFQHGFGWFWRQ